MNSSEILAGLRDVQEPLPPEAFIPWLLLANLLIAVIILALLISRRWRTRRAWRRDALVAIDEASQLPPQEASTSIAITLRRVMLHLEGPQINGLSGDAWLQRLDDRFDTDWFMSKGRGTFGDGLYAPCKLSVPELKSLCDHLSKLVQSLPIDSGQKRSSQTGTATASTSTSTS